MTRVTERCERAVLFATLAFLYLGPLLCYMLAFDACFTRVLIPVFGVTSCLSVSYAVLCLCFPGFVDNLPETINTLSYDVVQGCRYCMQFKPERAHHCTRCLRCIKKMDHHCHWLGRCINYDNLGHFIRFLFFTFLSNLILFVFNAYYIVDAVYITKSPLRNVQAAVALVSSMVAGLLVFVTGMHFSMQIRLIINNITHIEMLKKKNYGFIHKEDYDSIYNIGVYNNIVDVFGSPLFLFLWMPSGDGINFKKKIIHDSHYLDEVEPYDSELAEMV